MIKIKRWLRFIMSFREDLEIGMKAEELVEEFFKKHSNYKLIDVRQEEKYQLLDIDYLFEHDDKVYALEVKNSTDTIKKSNSIRVEHYEQYKSDYRKKDGWLWYSEADFFFFVDTINRDIYIVSVKRLRKYFYDESKKTTVPSFYVYDSNYKKTWNYWLNVDELVTSGIAKKRKCK